LKCTAFLGALSPLKLFKKILYAPTKIKNRWEIVSGDIVSAQQVIDSFLL
jgi:hypothetical protein